MLIIGLAGGIGTGKSTVAGMLGDMGAVVIDADRLIRDAYGPGGELASLVAAEFGPEVLAADGSADRAKIAAIVFGAPAALARINGIVHPWVRERWHAEVDAAAAQGFKVAVVEAALYVDKSVGFDQLWVTYVDRETQLQRTVGRGGLTREQAEARMAAQIAPAEHAAMPDVDVVVDTGGTLDEVRVRVRALWDAQVAPLIA